MLETIPSIKSREIVKGRPTVTGDESVFYRAHISKALDFIFGAVLTFIPPFVWGPAVLWLASKDDSGVVITDQRVMMFARAGLFKPGKYFQHQVPLRRISKAWINEGRRDLSERLLRVGDVVIEYEGDTGLKRISLPGIKKPKDLVRAVTSAKEKYGQGA